MKIDLTYKITPKTVTDAQGNEKKTLTGHMGTHFDVMDKEFPLEYTELEGIVFDVSCVKDRDISVSDIDAEKLEPGMFAAFCTGFIEEAGYGTSRYHHEHPQLSDELIDLLLNKEVRLIGIDFAGVRRGREHTPKDQYCADRGVFIIENMCSLGEVLKHGGGRFHAHTYPLNYAGMSGLPCRVVAEI